MYYHGKKALTAGVLSLLVMGSTATAWGAEAETSNDAETEEIVITANRIPNKKVDTPADVTVITSDQIAERGYRTVTDAIEDVPGARVLNASGPAFERMIMLNGDDRVLVMVDGRRFNNSVGVSRGKATIDANTLPPVSMIDRIEVVKGGASTLYGADAVGGVVNIITKTPEETTGTVHVGYGSWGTQDLSVSFGGKVNKTGLQVGASRNKASHLKYKDTDGNTKQWDGQSDYTQDAISLKLTQDFTKDDGLTINYDYSNLEGNFLAGLYGFDYYTYSYQPNTDQRHTAKKTNNFGVRYDWNRNAENSGYLQVYRNYLGYRNFGTNAYNDGEMSERNWAVEGQQNFALSDNNTLVAGAEYRNVKVDHTGVYEGTKGYNNKAVFLQDQWKFAPTWQVNTGVRYDNHSKAGSRTTGSIAFNKKFSQDSNAYLSWNSVFRAPTTDDLFWYQGDYMMFGNEDLKPEKGNVYNLGYNFKLTPKTEGSITAFYSQLRDAINWVSYPDWSYHAVNIDKQKKRGMSLSLVHHLNDNWDVNAAYTYVKVDNDTNNGSGYVRDDHYAPNYFQAGIRYHDPKLSVSLTGRGASGLSESYFGENHYFTMDLTARYNFTHNWTGFINCYNLNNAAYAEYSGVVDGQDNYPMPGRRFVVGAEYKF
ncbi:MAG: TonB-dependent receptor [Acidaminococcus sp.]|nr:TonB-dependent receptor [Acidaminococcus sp.]MCI2100820.1 TonB-dependent receptor [Acidaminococcus sp.]MCI2115183.1 TonB-dependent receptor [Acidaminococcus sp.]MCI2117258.1 TonB-dependent receptor [Acidaminococcus sp.]